MKIEPFVLREKTLGQLLDETVSRYPNKEALVYADRDYRQTWKQFDVLVDDLAKGLMALGVQKGEKVAVWATNVPYWITLQFATAKIGAILLTINTNCRESELRYILTQSDCENLFIISNFKDHSYLETIYKIVPELGVHPRENLRCPYFPHLKRIMFLGAEKHKGMYSVPEIMGLSCMISDEEYQERQDSLSPYDVVNMQYTSGTTGFPKGVMLTHINILNNGYWIGYHQRLSANDVVCIPVPLFHCFGCVLGVLACVNHGAKMVVLESFNPGFVMAAVEQEACTALYGVPTMFISIIEHRDFKKTNFSSLRTGIMAGSVCPEPLMRKVIELMNMSEITICYGLTESSPVMAQTHADEAFLRRVSTVGRCMPGMEVKIADPETCEELPRGTQGEIMCRGYNIMKGYYHMPDATKAAITDDGWLHSGDLGVMDNEGYIVVNGRIKDMIIRGGENIYPREIEEFILGMQEVLDVQVVGVLSQKYGEEVGAFIIVKEGMKLSAEAVRSYCRGRIATYKIPKYIVFVESYPLTASGKIQKYLLRQQAVELFSEAMK
ncbi:AMP-binding protein [Desulfovibrio litoralis]|uniref:Fatty-acyl-CoA synthase n=1 Tax=Desulfovibrio litoralis DSM 11393 TaxID=1121455 RepID=A0A1M7RTP3_9BACT|nr:fatty-acyl-CoA synthase [Desulfovibrio litoralis DSM 11393]